MKRITVAEAQASHPTINPETYICEYCNMQAVGSGGQFYRYGEMIYGYCAHCEEAGQRYHDVRFNEGDHGA